MTRSRKVTLAVTVALLAGLAPRPGQAQTPLYFPKTETLDTTSYTLRVSGTDRFATAAALSRVSAINQVPQTGFPFNSPDATTDAKAYGFGACPEAVGIAAGDTVADALAAAPLKDLGAVTFDGETVNTTNAVMLLTLSGRQGGTDLSPATLAVLADLKDACGTFDALVFGSIAAVPTTASEALQALATKVVRVSGTDRFDTARKIALAVGAGGGVANVDLFTATDTKTTLSNAVFLADGITGADALAVGPFAAHKNVPVVLAGGATLPTATRNALLALRPANIIVLGGTGVISDDVVKAATEASGAATKATRIAGADRYETSVKIAQQLLNIFAVEPPPLPIGGAPSADYSNVMMGLARSEGSAVNHVGFPDALASAWFLDTASDKGQAPKRVAPVIERNVDTVANDGTITNTTIGGAAGSRRAALLLTASKDLPAPITAHVTGMFPDPTRTSDDPEALNGGFGFVFGGPLAILQTPVLNLAQLLSGGTYIEADRTDLKTTMNSSRVFYSNMSFDTYTSKDGGGVDAQGAVAEGDKICALRGAFTGTQFLAVYQVTSFSSAGPIDYQDEASWPPAESRMQCVDASNTSSDRANVVAIGPSGHESATKPVDWSTPELRLTMPAPATDDKADTITGSGLTTEQMFDGGSGTQSATWSGTMDIVHKGTQVNGAQFTMTLNFTRQDPVGGGEPNFPGDPPDDYITFSGTLTMRNGAALLFNANLQGEALGNESPFKLVGMYQTSSTGQGGLRMILSGANLGITDFVLDGTA